MDTEAGLCDSVVKLSSRTPADPVKGLHECACTCICGVRECVACGECWGGSKGL